MVYVYWIFGALAVLYSIAVIFFVFASRRGVKHLLFTVFSGFFALLIAVILKGFAGYCLEFNLYTLAVSCFWGIPGVIMLIILGIIFL